MKAKVKFTGNYSAIETNLICQLEEINKGVYFFWYGNITSRQWQKLKRIYGICPLANTSHEIVKVYMKEKKPYEVLGERVIIEE